MTHNTRSNPESFSHHIMTRVLSSVTFNQSFRHSQSKTTFTITLCHVNSFPPGPLPTPITYRDIKPPRILSHNLSRPRLRHQIQRHLVLEIPTWLPSKYIPRSNEQPVLAGIFSDGRWPGMCDLGTMVKTKNVCRRRMRVRKLRYKVHAAEGDRGSELSENGASDSNGDRVLISEKEAIPAFDFDCGLYSEISIVGRRKEMEDEVRVELGLTAMNDEKYDFFAVYDGHGGAQVAQVCRERLHRIVAEEIVDRGEMDAAEWGRLMERCFERMDYEVISGAAVMKTVGSAVVAVVAGKDEVVVANCGDCRAVLARAGISLPLSNDHKPGRADELMRIESAGGQVINWNGYRVLGVLATSRSIGDEYLKPFVISKPEVTVTKRTDRDEFLILGSDGLWDVVSNEIACNVVRRCFRGKMKRISLKVANDSHVAEAAAVLAELAVARGSKDNISVIVVDLRK